VDGLRQNGVEVVPLPDREAHFSLVDALHDLHNRRVTHLLVEPGPTLTRSFLSRGQADRLWVFRSSNMLGEQGALAISSAPTVDYPMSGQLPVDAVDTLSEYLNSQSPAFFAPVPSADFVLAREELESPTESARTRE
jgi:riboflavin biosynthesis pyrimidine reductase